MDGVLTEGVLELNGRGALDAVAGRVDLDLVALAGRQLFQFQLRGQDGRNFVPGGRLGRPVPVPTHIQNSVKKSDSEPDQVPSRSPFG